MRRLATFYGANPLHLLALLGCFALAGYAALRTAANPDWPVMLAWFLAAIVGHDLVLFPLYALADRSLTAAAKAPHPRRTAAPPVPAINHLRLPALGSGLLFLLFFPGIIQQGAQTYLAATGQTQHPYLQRWLLLTAAMFGISAFAYAIRLHRAGTPQRAAAKAASRAIRTLTEPGERILTTAHRADGAPAAVATTRALYHPNAGTSPGWHRIRWEDLATVQWHQHDPAELVVTGLPGSGITPTTLPLASPARFPAIIRTLATATIITTRQVNLSPTHHALITVRKSPWSDHLIWTVKLDPGVDPNTPETQAQIDHALTAIRSDLGLNTPH